MSERLSPEEVTERTNREMAALKAAALEVAAHDPVNHPAHYTSDPSGVECIQITRHRTFNIGNAIKYLWRAGLKGGNDDSVHYLNRTTGKMHSSATDHQIEDLRKAVFYINDEIERLGGTK